ncbi:MAG TPA: hypothetical protein VJU54_12465, partial [Nitrospiraceae bacterium]|nr:hypothetical protein [Nitrospiraceae bacterium]
SKSWHECAEESFDLVITVCDQAAGESCPRFSGTPKKLHWSTPDPAKVTGSEAEIDAAFDKTFFLLRDRVEELVQCLPVPPAAARRRKGRIKERADYGKR